MPSLTDLHPQIGRPTSMRRPAAIDWQLLYDAVGALAQEVGERGPLQIAVVELLARAIQAEYVAWVTRDAEGRLEYQQERLPQWIAIQIPREEVAAEIEKTIARGMPSFSPWEDSWNVVVSHLPGPDSRPILAVIIPASLDPAMVSAVLQLVVLTLFRGQTAGRSTAEATQSATAAAALELVARLTGATDMKSAGKLICNLIRRHLGVERVAVGLVKPSRMLVEAVALSDVADVEQNTEATQLLSDCLTESLPQPPWITWSRTAETTPVGLGQWRRLADTWQATELAAVRFVDRGGSAIAVCLIASTKPIDSKAEQFLLLVSHIAGPLLRVLERAAQGHRLQKLKEHVPSWFHGRRAWALIAAVALPLVFPWSARTTCPVVLEPVAQRIIAAPFEGVFDRSLVLPGERVVAGQVLGRMDGRELRNRLSACQADLSRAAKSRDVNLAAGKLGASQIDRLEMDRLEHECSVLSRRLEQLEIRSPIAGVVVVGDLRRYESATLKIGQSLFEIAPLDQLVAELAVPEEDLEQVTVGADVSVWLDAISGGNQSVCVERINPRGELRDNRQVFIAETTLKNEQANLRPGMKGSATIIGPRSPGIWLLLRKPWFAACRFLGW